MTEKASVRALKHSLRPFVPALALTSLALSAGCGGGGSSSPATSLAASAKTASGLTARLAAQNASVSTGSDVTYTLSLTNPTAQAITVESEASSLVSLQIIDAAGKSVYTYPDPPSPPIAPAGIRITLQPGQSMTQQITPSGLTTTRGTYRATAAFYVADQETDLGPLTITVR